MAEIELRTTGERRHVVQVTDFLSSEVDWGRWRSTEQILKQIDTAFRCVYALDADRVVGFVRCFSDGVSAAYVADLYVVPQWRRQGIARRMLRELIEAGPGAQFRWMLHAAPQARDLYAEFGFESAPADFMERSGPPG